MFCHDLNEFFSRFIELSIGIHGKRLNGRFMFTLIINSKTLKRCVQLIHTCVSRVA